MIRRPARVFAFRSTAPCRCTTPSRDPRSPWHCENGNDHSQATTQKKQSNPVGQNVNDILAACQWNTATN
ncbi:hypothetical protein PUN28_005804 [Cardiocondyla obscurior]|uniref:Uncharacterized protein n=1 Tax=Cardiocondyla obscurior TaxID=286306 RepID=A0AAW2G8J6_9HYME